MGELKTDYVGGQPYEAADHNTENVLAILCATPNRHVYKTSNSDNFSTDNARQLYGYVSTTFATVADRVNNVYGNLDVITEWGITQYLGCCVMGGYAYVRDGTSTNNVKKVDLSTGVAVATTGLTMSTYYCTDGEFIYSGSGFAIEKYSISGTTFTLESTTNYGATSLIRFQVSGGKVYIVTSATAFSVYEEGTATLLYSGGSPANASMGALVNIEGVVAIGYTGGSSMLQFLAINI